MKRSIVLGLLGCLMTSACGGSAVPAPGMAKVETRALAVCEGPVTIRTQADVGSVGARCGAIDGDLRVIGASVTNLDGLEQLQSLRYLVVAENAKLDNVRGLRGLRSARAVTFIGNPLLGTLDGLEGLSELESAVVASNGITSITGLGKLRSVQEVVIADNPRLETLGGFAALKSARVFDVERNGPRSSGPAPSVHAATAGSTKG